MLISMPHLSAVSCPLFHAWWAAVSAEYVAQGPSTTFSLVSMLLPRFWKNGPIFSCNCFFRLIGTPHRSCTGGWMLVLCHLTLLRVNLSPLLGDRGLPQEIWSRGSWQIRNEVLRLISLAMSVRDPDTILHWETMVIKSNCAFLLLSTNGKLLKKCSASKLKQQQQNAIFLSKFKPPQGVN